MSLAQSVLQALVISSQLVVCHPNKLYHVPIIQTSQKLLAVEMVDFTKTSDPTALILSLHHPHTCITMFKKEYVQLHQLACQANNTRISPGAKSKVKSSAQRGIRTQVLETYPKLEPYIDEIMPKKSQLDLMKL